MSGRNLIAAAVAAVIVVGGAFLIGKYYNANTSTTIANTTMTVDDLPGLIDGRVKRVVDPIKTDVATIKRDLAETNGRVDKIGTDLAEHKGILTNIEKLIKERPTTTPTPATTTPTAPALSVNQQRRLAEVNRECLPEHRDIDLREDAPLSDEEFNKFIADCRAKKLVKQQVVSPPPAAGPQQVVQNGPAGDPDAVDGPDGQLDESGQPRAQMAYYNGGRQPGYNQGGRRCTPGTRPAGSFGCVGRTITNRAEIQVFDQRIPSGCVPGQVREVWKEGVDPQGRRVRYKITQHTECGPRRGY